MLEIATPPVTVCELTTAKELSSIRYEWQQLAQACGATPFQSPDWLIPWWDHFGGSGQLRTVVLRHERKLVGLAPLFLRRNQGRRELLFVGTGNSDHLDTLFAPEFAEAGRDAVFEFLAAAKSDWDRCDLEPLPPGSPLLNGSRVPGFKMAVVLQDVCPVLDLRAPNSRLEKMLRRAARNLERLGRIAEPRLTCARAADFEEHFDILLRLHAAGWNSRGGPGVLADPIVQSFHRHAAINLLRQGQLRLYRLSAGDRAVAAWYGFTGNDRVFFYLGGYDPEFARFSPGGIVLAHAIREAIRDGAVAFDFLRGQEAYKYHWGATDRPNYRLQLWQN